MDFEGGLTTGEQSQVSNTTMSHMYRGPKDGKQEENRWWQIYDYLDTLQQQITDKAKFVGDNLISEIEENDKKKQQKLELENQQKTLSQQKQIQNHERKKDAHKKQKTTDQDGNAQPKSNRQEEQVAKEEPAAERQPVQKEEEVQLI